MMHLQGELLILVDDEQRAADPSLIGADVNFVPLRVDED